MKKALWIATIAYIIFTISSLSLVLITRVISKGIAIAIIYVIISIMFIKKLKEAEEDDE